MTDNLPLRSGVTELLIAWSDGRRDALENLIPLVYEDLRRLAAGYMRQEAAGHALQPTALVHEAYVRLIDQKQVEWRNRAHFFGVAASMMRRILVDHARRRRAEKRDGNRERVTLTDNEVAAEEMRKKLARVGRGGASIPVIDIMGQIQVGFSPAALEQALASAKSSKGL